MTNMFDFFGLSQASGHASDPYLSIGLPRNPFREDSGSQADGTGPFYHGHIEAQLGTIQKWMFDVHNGNTRQPLSLAGNIGVGKTRILRHLQRGIQSIPPSERAAVDLIVLTETGYARGSVGGMLITSLERITLPTTEPTPFGVMPMVWNIIKSQTVDQSGTSPLANSLRDAVRVDAGQHADYALAITRWLNRWPLSSFESKWTGLYRRVDWEGEMVRIVADLVRIAQRTRVLSTLYLFIDQLEDLFSTRFSELRRSRILTDLRGLVDEIDPGGTPIGLVLSWSPEVRAATGTYGSTLESQFKNDYEALYSRIVRRRVDIPLLTFEDAVPFADEWLRSLEQINGYNPTHPRFPNTSELALSAWTRLVQQKRTLPGGKDRVTPRDFLASLATQVDIAAGIIVDTKPGVR